MSILRKEGFWLGIFFLIVAIFFYPTLLGGKLPVPSDALVGLYHPWRDALVSEYPRGMPFKNFLITDPVRQQIPWRKVVIDQWKEGNLPMWNPYNFSGTPLAANIQAAVFYPFNILFFFLPFPIAWTALIMIQPILAGLFLYIYLRHLRVHQLASLLGSITWSLSGFSVAWMTWGTIGHVALWFPLILLSIDNIIHEHKKSVTWVALLVAGLVFSFFAGHSQIFLYVASASVAYALWHLKLKTNESKRIQLWLLLSLGLFVVIAAVAWAPFMQLISDASRLGDLVTWQKPGWFLPWQHLVQFLAPDFFGNPTTLNYWGEWNYGEFIGYIGVVSLIFVGYALLRREAEGKFWTGVLALSLLFVLPNPISKLPYQLHLPIISALQPTRLMVLIDFALAMLTAYGFQSFIHHPKKSLFYVVGAVGIFLAALWVFVLVWPRFITDGMTANLAVAKRNLVLPSGLFIAGSALVFVWYRLYAVKRFTLIFGALLIVLISFDLLRFGWKFIPFTDAKYFFPTTTVIEFLQHQPKPFRVMSLDDRLFPPNSLAYYDLETIDGYDPIYSRSYEEFIAASERGRPDISPPYGFNRIIAPQNVDSPLVPLLNVRYVLSLVDIGRPYLRKVFQEGETRVYEDARVLPRVYFVEDVVYERDRQKILEHLFDKDFKPLELVFVEKPLSLLSVPVMLSEYAVIKEYKPSMIRLDVLAENTRFLLISNIYDIHWKANIDGKEVKIIRTNYIFQGLAVPEGKHEIILRYRG